ncbi:MAG: hypothetical protein JSS83_17855 [Cyanobacteria bacterium SZAS LIN-3]|nr:hypothetical protein [Cyanobacteria bacterium SZAS LIN-3]
MNRTFIKQMSLCLALAAGLSGLVGAEARARQKYTITTRINALSAKVARGQRSGELTLKEADSLRDDLNHINDKIDRYKSKNGGKLSYANQNTIEKDLNKVSLRVQKKELSKRAARPNE